MDVLAVKGRDEGRLEAMADIVADLVAAMLGIADLAGPPGQLVEASEHGLQQPGGTEDVRGILHEQLEEVLVARNQTQAHALLHLRPSGPHDSAWPVPASQARLPPRGHEGADTRRVRSSRTWTACTSRPSTSSTWPIAGRSGRDSSMPIWPPCSPTSWPSRKWSTSCNRIASSGPPERADMRRFVVGPGGPNTATASWSGSRSGPKPRRA